MNTYPDIFGLDPLPFPPWAPCGPHRHGQHKDPYIKETTKVAEIKDRFMKTRYKVTLSETENAEQPEQKPVFRISAVSYCYEEPKEITRRDFDTYEESVRFFEDVKKRLGMLARLDSRDAEDIRIYADKIGYRRIDPDCCRNCKWAKPADMRNCMFEEWRGRLRGKFFCMNSELYSEQLPDLDPDEGQHDDFHDFSESRWHILNITPVVDPDGICDKGYERRQKETPPCPPPRPPMPPPCPPGPFPPGPPPPPHNYVPGPLPYGKP